MQSVDTSSVCPRSSFLYRGGSDHFTEKCLVPTHASGLSLSSDDIKRISKIKLTIAPAQRASISLCMRGRSTCVDIMNLTSKSQHARLYMSEVGRLFLATAKNPSQAPTEQFAKIAKSLGTNRELTEVPSAQQTQTAIIAAPDGIDPLLTMKATGVDNIRDGGLSALSATTSLAASSVQLTMHAGSTGVALAQYLMALSMGQRLDQMAQIATGLASLGANGVALSAATTQTAKDLMSVGYRLGQTLYGAGQYTYAATQKPDEAPVEEPEPKISLVEKPFLASEIDLAKTSFLDIEMDDDSNANAKPQDLDAIDTEDALIETFGFETV